MASSEEDPSGNSSTRGRVAGERRTPEEQIELLRKAVMELQTALSRLGSHTDTCTEWVLSGMYNKGYSRAPDENGGDCDCGFNKAQKIAREALE